MYQKLFKPLAIFSNIGAGLLFLTVAIASNVSESARETVFQIAGFVVSVLAFVLPVTFIVTFCIATIYFIRNGFPGRRMAGKEVKEVKDTKKKDEVSLFLFIFTMIVFLFFTNLFQALLT